MRAWLVVLVILLAGCIGAGTQREAPDPDAKAPAAEPGRRVIGVVVDEEEAPIAGATVRALDTNRSAETDSAGAFNLSGLPSENGLLVQADHPEYKSRTLRVDLLFVPQADLRFVLERRPMDSKNRTFTFPGFIPCGAVVGSEEGAGGAHRADCRTPVPDVRDHVKAPFEAGTVAIILELVWTPGSLAADVLGMDVLTNATGIVLAETHVHAEPHEHYLSVYLGGSVLAPALASGGTIDALVQIEGGVIDDDEVPANAGAAIQQDFTLYWTVFQGEAPPTTWTHVKR